MDRTASTLTYLFSYLEIYMKPSYERFSPSLNRIEDKNQTQIPSYKKVNDSFFTPLLFKLTLRFIYAGKHHISETLQLIYMFTSTNQL